VDLTNKLLIDGIILLKRLEFDYESRPNATSAPNIKEVWVPAIITAIEDNQFTVQILKTDQMTVVEKNQYGHTWKFR
jgi:hypothetical protein